MSYCLAQVHRAKRFTSAKDFIFENQKAPSNFVTLYKGLFMRFMDSGVDWSVH